MLQAANQLGIRIVSTAEELEKVRADWNRLAGDIPFRSAQWLHTWWNYYGSPDNDDPAGDKPKLRVILVEGPNDELLGIAPFYMQHHPVWGQVLRLLGDGEVCSEYVGLMAHPDWTAEVIHVLAETLINGTLTRTTLTDGGENFDKFANNGLGKWDMLQLDAISDNDQVTTALVDLLATRELLVHQSSGPSCWRLNLPATWNDYLTLLGKSHRKQARRAVRKLFNTNLAVHHTVHDLSEFPTGWDHLVRLHQLRRESLGELGSFSSERFRAFHRDVAQQMLQAGMLHLHWIEYQQQPIAAEYQLVSRGVIYAYQSGMEPDKANLEPGNLAAIAYLRDAITDGDLAVDLLRGDEPYKSKWRAQPQSAKNYRIASDSSLAQWKHYLWRVGSHVRDWVRKTPTQAGVI